MKRVKNYLKLTIGHEKLTNSALLCIEHDFMKYLNVDHIINCLATMKHRNFFLKLTQIHVLVCLFFFREVLIKIFLQKLFGI